MPDSRLGVVKLLVPRSSCCKDRQELLPPHSAGKIPDSVGLSLNSSSVNEENAPASPHMLGNEPAYNLRK